jgi:hypothetical protein
MRLAIERFTRLDSVVVHDRSDLNRLGVSKTGTGSHHRAPAHSPRALGNLLASLASLCKVLVVVSGRFANTLFPRGSKVIDVPTRTRTHAVCMQVWFLIVDEVQDMIHRKRPSGRTCACVCACVSACGHRPLPHSEPRWTPGRAQARARLHRRRMVRGREHVAHTHTHTPHHRESTHTLLLSATPTGIRHTIADMLCPAPIKQQWGVACGHRVQDAFLERHTCTQTVPTPPRVHTPPVTPS